MTTFTKEQLAVLARGYDIEPYPDRSDLAAFALSLMAERDEAQRELARAIEEIKQLTAPVEVGGGKTLGYVRYELLDEARRELVLLTKAIQDSYEMDPDGSVYALETDEDARVTWPDHPEVLGAVRRALARKEGA